MAEAADSLRDLLASGEESESRFQRLMEEMSELIPTLDMLNHDVQWGSAISKLQIAADKIVDLAYITKSTDTWRLVLFELEQPGKRLFVDNPYPDFHVATRQAIAQVDYWKNITESDPKAIREQLRPLMHLGGHWDTNPLEFAYVLIIGRSASGELSEGHANLLSRLRREKRIRLLTWDSVLRMAESDERGKLNVLSHHRGTFQFKYAQGETNLFAVFTPEQIVLDEDKETWFRANGYNIDAWRDGKRLLLDCKQPGEALEEAFKRALR